MASRMPGVQSEHDRVVEASASTYGALQAEGCHVTTNPGPYKNRFVGHANDPQYPDVIVWRPNGPGASSGTAVVIEEIETADSVTEDESRQWAKYGRLGVNMFRLIVPWGMCQRALELVQRFHILVNEVWGYYSEAGVVKFKKYTN